MQIYKCLSFKQIIFLNISKKILTKIIKYKKYNLKKSNTYISLWHILKMLTRDAACIYYRYYFSFRILKNEWWSYTIGISNHSRRYKSTTISLRRKQIGKNKMIKKGKKSAVFKCKQCTFKTLYSTSLRRHVNVTHNEIKFSCQCGKQFGGK